MSLKAAVGPKKVKIQTVIYGHSGVYRIVGIAASQDHFLQTPKALLVFCYVQPWI